MTTDGHDLESTAFRMTERVPLAAPGDTAEMIRASLAGRHFDSAADIAILEGDRLVGLIRLEDLLAAPPEATAASLMDDDPPVVAPGADRELAAWKAVRHGEGSLAVTDEAGRFLGLVPPPALLSVLLQEHDEDLDRAAGISRATEGARTASLEPVASRLRHRLPWLIVGLLGAVVAAEIVGAYESALEANVALAFFLPGIVYMADAVGTQTETLVVRGFSVGVPLRRILLRELVTGLVVGGVLAVVLLPVVMLRWGDPRVALSVSLALLAACSVATGIAMTLPALLARLGVDPAFGSGPLATVVQDLLSILIYFAIASALT